jgi:hypothetical protein
LNSWRYELRVLMQNLLVLGAFLVTHSSFFDSKYASQVS